MTENNYKQAMDIISSSDAVLISASNGLSIAEGYHIFADNEDFRKYFGYFRSEYGIDCIIRGVFAPLPREEHLRFMSAVHKYMIDDYTGSEIFKNLLEITGNKDYFVITSNGDTHFQINGFESDKIFEVEGNFDGMEEGSPQWEKQKEAFTRFVAKYAHKKLSVLELGIGAGNQLIKAPLMNMVKEHANWNFITLNLPHEINIPSEITSRSLALAGDIGTSFKEMKKYM